MLGTLKLLTYREREGERERERDGATDDGKGDGDAHDQVPPARER